MKNLIYLSIVAGLFFMSCVNSNQYKISGVVANESFEGTNVYLQKMADNSMIITDTSVVKNGEFFFSGSADSSVLRFVTLDETINAEIDKRVPVLIEPGKLTVNFDTLITVTGTQVNDTYNSLRLEQQSLIKQIREVVGRYNKAQSEGSLTDELDAEINNEYDAINSKLVDLNFNFTKNNINNELGQFLFVTSSSMFEPEQQKEILANAGDTFKEKENVKGIINRLEALEKVAIGKKFIDFTLNDPSGKEVSLSDYAGNGKYVLVDFWAAWCGPCRREMPNVVAAYEKYKSKGFEVVGVSFDQNHEEWTKGIKELNITWPQMSDLMYWSSPVVGLYAISGIPHTILLDKDGVIIEKDLRGEKLEAKLAELMP